MENEASQTDSTNLTLEDHKPNAPNPTLYRHSKRDQWGLGIVEERFDDRVSLIFQDGRMRKFKNGFYHLLEAVDRPYDVTDRIVTNLESMSGKKKKSAARKSTTKPVSLEEQLEFFSGLFADGFVGEEYISEHRGDGRKRPLKRHRDAIIERAQTLNKSGFSKRRRAGEHKELFDEMAHVLNSTDLISPKERKGFAKIKPKHHEALADSLFALLYGGSAFHTRFDGWVRTLESAMGSTPSWGLATALLAAVHADEHCIINQKTVATQAQWMAPGVAVGTVPSGVLYERLLGMIQKVKSFLEEQDMEPADMFDVVNFMVLTLKPAARKKIQTARRSRKSIAKVAAQDQAREAA